MHLQLNLARWLRAHAVTLAALALICVQIGLTATLLAHSYFRQEDFLILDRAAATPRPGWTYLMWLGGARDGHLMPAGLAITWALARTPLYNWPLASVVICVLVAAAAVAGLRLLLILFGERPAILVPLAVYLFGPLSLGAVAWWSAALEALPLQLAIFMATAAHVRYVRDQRLRHAIAAAIWLAIGMAAADQGALVPLLLLAITSAYLVPGRWARAAGDAITRYWRAWLLYGAVLAAYCAVFFYQLVSSDISPSGPGLATRLYAFAGTLIGKAALPGALGGPWRWLASDFAQVSPPATLEYLSWAVAALVIGVSCLYRMRAWRAWAILLGWIVAADIVPAAIAGFGTLPATSLGAQAGYLADATPVLALCAALAFIPVTPPAPAQEPQPAPEPQPAANPDPSPAANPERPPAPNALRPLPRPVRVVTLLVFCVFVAGTIVSFQSFETTNPERVSRSYIATARLAVARAPRGTVIVDGPTPAKVMNSGFFPAPQAYTSTVVGALAPHQKTARWTLTLAGVFADPMTFDDHGQLRPVTVEGLGKTRLRGCWKVTGVGMDIKLSGSLYQWPWTARLTYSGPSGRLAVSFGGDWTQVRVPAGRHVVYVPLLGSGGTVSVQFIGGTTRPLCLTAVTVGSLHPDPAGRAIPAAPVPG